MNVRQHVAALEGRVVVVAGAVAGGQVLGPAGNAVAAVHVAGQRDELQGRDRVVVVERLQGRLDLGGGVADHVDVHDLHVVALTRAPGHQGGGAVGDGGVAVTDQGPGAVGLGGARLVGREAGDVPVHPGGEGVGQGARLRPAARPAQLDHDAAGRGGGAGHGVVIQGRDGQRHHATAGHHRGGADAQAGRIGPGGLIGRAIDHHVVRMPRLHRQKTQRRQGRRLLPHHARRRLGAAGHRHQPRGDGTGGRAVGAVDRAAVQGQGAPGLAVDLDVVDAEAVEGDLQADRRRITGDLTPDGRRVAGRIRQRQQARRGRDESRRNQDREKGQNGQGDTARGVGEHPEPPKTKTGTDRRGVAGFNFTPIHGIIEGDLTNYHT